MRFGGIVLATLLTLAACSSDPEPTEPKPTTSATPTVTAPTMPAQAKENTPEGASAFVAHYIDVFNYAANTGDVEELSDISSASCTACHSYVDEFKAIYARGDRISQHLWTLKTMDVDTDGQEFRVTAQVDVNEGDETTDYKFVFLLPLPQPFEVASIKILGTA